MFTKATKKMSRGRMALSGPSGSGKTYTALKVATVMAQGGRIAVIDTERGSASKYAHLFEFDVCELEDFSPQSYVKAINAADEAGYAILVVDSLSHAWSGIGGALEIVDEEMARNRGNKFAAWRTVTPMHNALVEAILQSPCHVIATMRSKTEYVLELDDRGKQVPKKVGMAPVQRDGMEYEFDVHAEMDHQNTLVVSKSRCPELNGRVFKKPGEEFAKTFLDWLSTGSAAAESAKEDAPAPPKAKVAGPKSAPSKQPTMSEQIEKSATPQLLEAKLSKWILAKPVKSDLATWEKAYEASLAKYSSAAWGDLPSDDTDGLAQTLKQIRECIDLEKQASLAM